MKREGTDIIMYGLFVDDMMHIPTCDRLRDEFLELYQKDFEITGEGLIETFLGMEVEQPGKVIRLQYIRSVLDEYKEFIKKSFRPKRVPMSPRLVLNDMDGPTIPDPRTQKFYLSFIAKLRLRFAASWIRFDISYTVSSLARFCTFAGPSQWAALHHLMEYLEGFPSLKLTYRRRTGVDDGLSGFADADWGNSSSRRSTSDNLCLLTGHRFFGDRSSRRPQRCRQLRQNTKPPRRRLQKSCTSALSPQPSRELGLCPIRPDTGVRGQHCVHRVGKPRHWWT
jgi:hypothetical protein